MVFCSQCGTLVLLSSLCTVCEETTSTCSKKKPRGDRKFVRSLLMPEQYLLLMFVIISKLNSTPAILYFQQYQTQVIILESDTPKMLKQRFNGMTPIKQLQFLTRLFFVFSILFLILVFSSLVITASNLMVTNELNT